METVVEVELEVGKVDIMDGGWRRVKCACERGSRIEVRIGLGFVVLGLRYQWWMAKHNCKIGFAALMLETGEGS